MDQSVTSEKQTVPGQDREIFNPAVYDWDAQNMRDLVKLSAFDEENEPHRLVRMRKVYREVNLVCHLLRGAPLPIGAITRMHDHKGVIAVEYQSDEWLEGLSDVVNFVWKFAEGEEVNCSCVVGDGEDGGNGFDEVSSEEWCNYELAQRARVKEYGDFDLLMADAVGPDGETYGHRD